MDFNLARELSRLMEGMTFLELAHFMNGMNCVMAWKAYEDYLRGL